MVRQGYKDWYELCRKFPSGILNEIDQLWVKYSQGKFGFSIQKRIWESVGGSPDAGYLTWKEFGEQVEWYSEENDHDWKEYKSLPFSIESSKGNLPALYATRFNGFCSNFFDYSTCHMYFGFRVGGGSWGVKWGVVEVLVAGSVYWGDDLGTSLFSHQDLTYKV